MSENPRQKYLLQFERIVHIMDDYNLTEREIAAAAFNGEIKLYNYFAITSGKNFIEFSQFEIIDFYFKGYFKTLNIYTDIDEDGEKYPVLNKTNIIVKIPEIEEAFSIIKFSTAPPLLLTALKCWRELFGKEVEACAAGETTGNKIETWIEKNCPILMNREHETLRNDLKIIITPTKWVGTGIKTDYSKLNGKNKADHKFYSEKLDNVCTLWREASRRANPALETFNKKYLKEQIAKAGKADKRQLKSILFS